MNRLRGQRQRHHGRHMGTGVGRHPHHVPRLGRGPPSEGSKCNERRLTPQPQARHVHGSHVGPSPRLRGVPSRPPPPESNALTRRETLYPYYDGVGPGPRIGLFRRLSGPTAPYRSQGLSEAPVWTYRGSQRGRINPPTPLDGAHAGAISAMQTAIDGVDDPRGPHWWHRNPESSYRSPWRLPRSGAGPKCKPPEGVGVAPSEGPDRCSVRTPICTSVRTRETHASTRPPSGGRSAAKLVSDPRVRGVIGRCRRSGHTNPRRRRLADPSDGDRYHVPG